MSIRNPRELEVTRAKLHELEQQCARLQILPAPDRHVRELTLLSRKKLVNQMKEEIARFEARAPTSPPSPA